MFIRTVLAFGIALLMLPAAALPQSLPPPDQDIIVRAGHHPPSFRRDERSHPAAEGHRQRQLDC